MVVAKSDFGRQEILDLLRHNRLTSWFQPIFSTTTGKIYGYEALARLVDPQADTGCIGGLFARAQAENLTPWLDMLCQENAFSRAAALDMHCSEAFLYVNVCPESLMYQDFSDASAGAAFKREKVVLEITEQEAIRVQITVGAAVYGPVTLLLEYRKAEMATLAGGFEGMTAVAIRCEGEAAIRENVSWCPLLLAA